MVEKGKFVVYGGIDGCGKGTQLLLSVPYLFEKDKYNQIFVTREPTHRSKEIREKLSTQDKSSLDGLWFFNHFMTDREQHSRIDINYNLAKGINVVSDRYQESTDTYQPTQGGITLEEVAAKTKELHIRTPDLELIYDLPAEVAFERRRVAGATSIFDKDLEFQERLRQAYLALPGQFPNRNIHIIDANRPREVVFEDTKKHLDKIFGYQ